ncbi:MAG: hypothetical protein C4523_07835 [Myxococcales bacterium]|nr:MAG: hypothetical protein C4523_07835 [Myxococcales bacterium]
MVFRLRLEAGDSVKITVAPQTEGYDPSLYLLANCLPSPAECLAISDDGGPGEPESFSYYAANAITVYIVVDSYRIPDVEGGRGEFDIAALRQPNLDTCEPCSQEDPDVCGPKGACTAVWGPNTPYEYACAERCESDDECDQGFACLTRTLFDNTQAEVCAPEYGEIDRHAVATCGALRDLGTPCAWQAFSDNDAACGADETAGEAIDDAICFFFFELTDLVSYCTIYCVDDSECPDGWFCYDVPLSTDFVCKLR